MDQHALARQHAVGRRLNGAERVVGAAVIVVACVCGSGVHVVIARGVLLRLPEGKALAVGQAVLRVALHTARHGGHGKVSRLRAVAVGEEERLARAAAEAGEPALLVLHVPEGDARQVGGALLLGAQQHGEQLLIAPRHCLVACGGDVGIEQIKLRHVDFQPEGAEAAQGAVIIAHAGAHRQVALHTHAVHKALCQQRLQNEILDRLALFGAERVIIIVKELHIGRSVFSRNAERLQHKVLAHRFRPQGGAHLAVVDSLIHHVPGINDAGVFLLRKADHLADIGIQAGQHGFTAGERGGRRTAVALREEPARRLVVPGERVAAHPHVVFFCKLKIVENAVEAQGGAEQVCVRVFTVFRLVEQAFRLHVVFTRQRIVLLRQRTQCGRAFKRLRRYGCANAAIRAVDFLKAHVCFHSPIPKTDV